MHIVIHRPHSIFSPRKRFSFMLSPLYSGLCWAAQFQAVQLQIVTVVVLVMSSTRGVEFIWRKLGISNTRKKP